MTLFRVIRMEFDCEVTLKPEFHALGMVSEEIPFMQGPKHIPQLWRKIVPRIGEIAQFAVKPFGELGVMKDFDQRTKTFK